MGVPSNRRIDVDLGSAEVKQIVVAYADGAGRSVSDLAAELLKAAAGLGGDNRRRMPRDRRGHRAAAVMLTAGITLRRLLVELQDDAETIDRERLRAGLQNALDTLTEAIASLE